MTVSVLLVSHDGERWLPAVLDALAAQTRRPERVVAIDTGSTDRSPALLHERLGDGDVAVVQEILQTPAESSYPAAVRSGLAALSDGPTEQPEQQEWVWLLHDDSAPAPDALEQLLAASEQNPAAAILGPKLREWPSLRRLLEVGVTISGTGHRETGLERGEYDQGQHDRIRETLAVNTAGMLVRREVLDALGLDDRLPVFGNDLDFGWRAARAGHRCIFVPDAVVFHVEAAHRGVRRTPATGDRPRRAERRAALYVLLVNCSGPAFLFQALRLLFGSLARAVGLLLVRAPGEAVDELAALASTCTRPQSILAGRRARRTSATVPAKDVRHLLAAPWVPYRHGLDLVTDLVAAVMHQRQDMSGDLDHRGNRSRRVGNAETGPVPAEAQNLPADTGLLARLLASPTAAVFAILVVASFVAARGLFGAGMLSGGALLPAPGGAGEWWRLYLESWHATGPGSATPAAPYLLPLAVAGTVLLGKAWLVLDLVLLFVVPLAAMGGYRFLRLVTRSRTVSLWGAVAYALLPVLGGAVQQGRLGTVAATLVLPWLAHAAWFLGPDQSVERRWRAAWRTSLLLALLVAFTPLAWVYAAMVLVVHVLVVSVRRRTVRGGTWGPALTAVVTVPVLLLPWSVLIWGDRGVASGVFEAGLPLPSLTTSLDVWDIVLGRPDDAAAAPAWLSAGLVVAALAALFRADTRTRVLGAWVVITAGLCLVAAVSTRSLSFGGPDQSVWLGFPLLVVHAAGICAAAVAGTGIRSRLSRSSFTWRQPLGLLVVAVALISPGAGLVCWVISGDDRPLHRAPVTAVPTYMTDLLLDHPERGVLLVRGAQDEGFGYVVLRGPGIRLGEDAVTPSRAQQQETTGLVADLVTAPDVADITALSERGVQFIYAPAPADTQLVGNLDSVSGLSSASAVRPGARAWQLDRPATAAGLADPGSSIRPWLLALQAAALLGVAVLAAPTRKVRR